MCSSSCSDPFAGHVAQLLSPFGRIDPKLEKLPRSVTSRFGVRYRDIRIAVEGEQLLPPLKPIAVLPEPAAFRRHEEVEALAEGHPTRVANDALSGSRSPDACGELPSRPADGLILRHELWAA